jgi:hypothetical protein
MLSECLRGLFGLCEFVPDAIPAAGDEFISNGKDVGGAGISAQAGKKTATACFLPSP